MPRLLRRVAAVTLLLALAALAFALPASAGGRPIHVALTGAAERPGPGDPDGSGTAAFTFNRGTGEVCWTIDVEGITLPAAAAHIHVAPVTDPGPIVIGLTAPDATGHSSGCVTADRALVKAITKDPGAYYVNVHTSDLPAGALRAQLG
ncbi:MAG TPA: CHRD domain-containing protein [Actinomycetota bacterium]|nr:CHRD domain-containing protein [Actinomycetota bacterium]